MSLLRLAALASLALALVAVAAAGGSCQSYGHSCLGGHGKRSDGLLLLLQQALRTREPLPDYDYRLPEREALEYLSDYADKAKGLRNTNQKMKLGFFEAEGDGLL